MNLSRQYILKSQLANALGVSQGYLKKRLIAYEADIKAVYPEYERTSKLLPPKVVDLVLKKTGGTWDDIDQ